MLCVSIQQKLPILYYVNEYDNNTLFRFFTGAIATYRGKSSFVEYSAGGAAAGAVYKFPMGPKAMVSGALAGGVLGTVAGLLTLAILKFTGTTAEEIRFWRKGYKEYEKRYLSVSHLDPNINNNLLSYIIL